MKKILSSMLALLLVLTILPTNLHADENQGEESNVIANEIVVKLDSETQNDFDSIEDFGAKWMHLAFKEKIWGLKYYEMGMDYKIQNSHKLELENIGSIDLGKGVLGGADIVIPMDGNEIYNPVEISYREYTRGYYLPRKETRMILTVSRKKEVPEYMVAKEYEYADEIIESGSTIPYKHRLVMVAKNPEDSSDKAYFNSITAVKINDRTYTREELGYNLYWGVLTLTDLIETGENHITVYADKYKDFNYVVTKEKGISEAKLVYAEKEIDDAELTVCRNEDIIIALSYTDEDYSLTALRNGENVIPEENYTIEEKYVDFGHKFVLTINASHLNIGENTLNLDSKNYTDKSFKITVKDEDLIIKDVPEYVALKESTYDEEVIESGSTIAAEDDLYMIARNPEDSSDDDYYESITAVKVNGKTYTRKELGFKIYYGTIKFTELLRTGENEITVYADLYKDYSFEITKAKKESEAKFIKGEDTIEDSELTVYKDEDILIALSYSDEDYNLTALKNGEEVISEDKYTVEEKKIGYGHYFVLTINASELKIGENILNLESKDFTDKSFEITVKNEDTPIKAVPEYVVFKDGTSYFANVLKSGDTLADGKSLILYTEGKGSDEKDYYKKVKEIKINDKVYTVKDLSNDINYYYMTYNLTKYLKDGNNQITVYAKHYEDFNFEIVK